jgi:hypothetical protein
MLTHEHSDNGGGCAAADPDFAPRRVPGPHLQPQGSLTRSPRRRPSTALDLGASTAPNRRTARAGQRLPHPHAARTTRPNNKITLTEVSTVPGDCLLGDVSSNTELIKWRAWVLGDAAIVGG